MKLLLAVGSGEYQFDSDVLRRKVSEIEDNLLVQAVVHRKTV